MRHASRDRWRGPPACEDRRFHPESDIDFVAVLDHRPDPDELRALTLAQPTMAEKSRRPF